MLDNLEVSRDEDQGGAGSGGRGQGKPSTAAGHEGDMRD